MSLRNGYAKKSARFVIEFCPAICYHTYRHANSLKKEVDSMTESGLLIFLGVIILFVVTVAVVTVVSAVTSSVAAIAQKNFDEEE